MDPCRRPGSLGRGWLGTGESGGAEVHFSSMYQKIKFVPMLNMDPLHIAWTPADIQAVQGEVGLEQESLGALKCIFH